MRTTIRTMLLVAAAATLLQPVPAAAQSTAEVEIQDSTFTPADVTVEVGDTVTWTQTGSLPHSVTADDGTFDSSPDCAGGSGCLDEGDTFTHTFDEPGEYAYYCRVHGAPGGVGMAGVVTVTAADSEPDDGTDEGSDGEAEVTGSLTLTDQSGDGNSVVVAEATISGSDGWIVVHADDDGGPGAVLGHVALPEGTSSNVEVPLDEALGADATVWPMLHVDAGEEGVYEFPGTDGPVTADGDVVVASLSYTLEVAGEAEPEDTGSDDGSMPVTGAPLIALALAGLLTISGGAVAIRRRGRGA
ncbi:MAG: plastocyanin/azurin family copper-binding protein [Nitriliruptoraceae bacterium]